MNVFSSSHGIHSDETQNSWTFSSRITASSEIVRASSKRRRNSRKICLILRLLNCWEMLFVQLQVYSISPFLRQSKQPLIFHVQRNGRMLHYKMSKIILREYLLELQISSGTLSARGMFHTYAMLANGWITLM